MIDQPSSLPLTVVIMLLLCILFCPILNGQSAEPTIEQVNRFLASDNSVKAAVFTKLFILEHATKENGNFKFSFPVIQVTVTIDGAIHSQVLSPATLFIGNPEYNLEYEIKINPSVSVAIKQDESWKYPTLFIGGLACGVAAGYFMGRIK